MEQTSLTARITALLLTKLEQETDPEKAAKWVELLERVVAGQIRRFDEEKSRLNYSPQSPVSTEGR